MERVLPSVSNRVREESAMLLLVITDLQLHPSFSLNHLRMLWSYCSLGRYRIPVFEQQ